MIIKKIINYIFPDKKLFYRPLFIGLFIGTIELVRSYIDFHQIILLAYLAGFLGTYIINIWCFHLNEKISSTFEEPLKIPLEINQESKEQYKEENDQQKILTLTEIFKNNKP